MIYRTKAVRDDRAAEDAAEIERFARDARARRRKAAGGVAVATVTALFAVMVLPALLEPRATSACHHVTIRWENAPEVPPNSYTVCRER